jgi:PAS domain S-box-containing protein
MNVLKDELPNSDINIEHMDSKRLSNQKYYEDLYRIYQYKYSHQKIDAIISIDNDAFDFLIKYRDDLLPGTPVVFCGVNNFTKNRLTDHSLFTGIAENPDIKANIDIALKLHPNTKNIAVITDKTSTNLALKYNLAITVLGMKSKLNLSYIEDTNITDVQKKILELPADSIILVMTPEFKDFFGESISSTEGVKIISSTSNVPIYSLWGFYMNNGIVGGLLTSGATQGKQAADMTIKIYNGTKISDIPIINNSFGNQLIFDYNQLQQYGIKKNLLPLGSTIINSPPKSYTINKEMLWISVLIIILILLIAVIILSIVNSKLKRMDTALKESEDRYRKLVDFLPDAIYVFHNGINVFSNASGLKLLGVNSEDELLGHKIVEYISPDSSSLKIEKMNSLLHSNNSMPLHEYKIIKKDGTEIYAESSSIAFPWDGGTALLIVARDITERKQSEELERKLEENKILLRETMELDVLKTEFFANISHELKTPLNIVLSSAQMIEAINKGNIKLDNNTKADKYICMMKQNCFRLIRIVDNLIDSTKIDTGYFQLYLKNLDIVSVVENITLSVAKYIEDKGINLIFDTDIEEKTIACDGEKIERIILNLLSNATKFTNEGGSIFVNVSVNHKIDSVILSVKDTGIGIPKDKLEDIFERFVQVDESKESNHLGSGIGLSIVKSLVEMHEGKIHVESEPGCGSEFIIELPANVLPEAGEVQKNSGYPKQISRDRINIEFSDIFDCKN